MEQIVADPVPQILDGVQHVPRERLHYRVLEQWSLLLVKVISSVSECVFLLLNASF